MQMTLYASPGIQPMHKLAGFPVITVIINDYMSSRYAEQPPPSPCVSHMQL